MRKPSLKLVLFKDLDVGQEFWLPIVIGDANPFWARYRKCIEIRVVGMAIINSTRVDDTLYEYLHLQDLDIVFTN